MLNNKKILIGVCGSISAYKTVLLVRLLIKEGAEVKVIMTPSAKEFVGPLTFSTLSKNEVYTDFVQTEGALWTNHVELGLWADLLVIAPLTASTLAKLANGLADNLMVACYLSAKCPVMVAPAMDLDMWEHPSTKRNIDILQTDGITIIKPAIGELASGLTGQGRLAEPDEILEEIIKILYSTSEFSGKRILISAGTTHEAIDPVRYISNHSSGKMGYALAKEFALNGGLVTLVSGPSQQKLSNESIKLITVNSATEMNEACLTFSAEADIMIMAAAVADYTPKEKAQEKIKKGESTWLLELMKTPDILLSLGKNKQSHQFLVGFALETENEIQNAMSKMTRKNCDLMVLNSLKDKGAGFGYDTNKVTLITAEGNPEHLPLMDKVDVAKAIVKKIKSLLRK